MVRGCEPTTRTYNSEMSGSDSTGKSHRTSCGAYRLGSPALLALATQLYVASSSGRLHHPAYNSESSGSDSTSNFNSTEVVRAKKFGSRRPYSSSKFNSTEVVRAKKFGPPLQNSNGLPSVDGRLLRFHRARVHCHDEKALGNYHKGRQLIRRPVCRG